MPTYRLLACLLDITSLIWRRINLSSAITLAQLHNILQVVMGWENCHLHRFDAGDLRYGERNPDYDPPDQIRDEKKVKLSKVFPGISARLLYLYDFGDNWSHAVTLEQIMPVDPKVVYPRAVDGARSCPPEDCGGPPGYEEPLNILAHPRHA